MLDDADDGEDPGDDPALLEDDHSDDDKAFLVVLQKLTELAQERAGA